VLLKRGLGAQAANLFHEILTNSLFNAPIYKTYGALINSQKFEPAGFKLPLGLKDNRLLLAAAGIALGLAAAAGLTHLMSSLLFGVTALDPLTYAAVSALLLVVSVLASYLPARRAMIIDPVQALRGE